MSRDTSTSTTEDGPLDGHLVNAIIGLVWANIFMGGMIVLHTYGWIVL